MTLDTTITLRPADVRFINYALRDYLRERVASPSHWMIELAEQFTKAGDGATVELGELYVENDGPEGWGHPMKLDSTADWVNFEWYVEYVKSKLSLASSMTPLTIIETGVYGMVGEVGELVDHLKKHKYHSDVVYGGQKTDPEYVLLELGDIMFYVTCELLGFKLNMSDVLKANVAKLNARYKANATKEESENRAEGSPEAIHQPTAHVGSPQVLAEPVFDMCEVVHAPTAYKCTRAKGHPSPHQSGTGTEWWSTNEDMCVCGVDRGSHMANPNRNIEGCMGFQLEGKQWFDVKPQPGLEPHKLEPIGRCKNFVSGDHGSSRQCVLYNEHDGKCRATLQGKPAGSL